MIETELPPAATVAVEGIEIAVLALRLVNVTAVTGAPFKVALQTNMAPAAAGLGVQASEISFSFWIVRVAAAWFCPRTALTLAVPAGAETAAAAEKVAAVLPAAIVTAGGTVRAALLLDKVMTDPPAGAAVGIRTVHVDLVPPTTVTGAQESVRGGGAVMLTCVVAEPRPSFAVTTAEAAVVPAAFDVNSTEAAPE